MKSILVLPPALQAVWTAVYSQILTAHSTSQVPGMIGELSRERAEHEAWEAVRRANGGEMPGEHEREEEKRLAILNEAVKQPCPVTGEPFFMVLEHPDLGWVPTYGGPHDSWTAPERDGVDPDEGRAPMLFRWHYDHDEGAWGEYEDMGMRAVVTTRPAEEPTDEEMVEALAPIVAAAHSGNAWASWPEQDRPYKIARFELLLQNDKVSADLLERQLVDAALASWKAARAWGRK